MKKTLSLRAMLIGLFLAAVIGAVVLAVTGWTTNQRLIDSQRYITNDVMPLQNASREMVSTMGAFGQRHADLLAAESTAELTDVTPRETLDERFTKARDALASDDAETQSDQLSALDGHYQTLLDSDTALENVRQEELSLQARMTERLADMQALISEVMRSAGDIAGRTALVQVREQRALEDRITAWREDGMTTLPTGLLDSVFSNDADITRLSSEVRTAVAMLADLGRRLMQVESDDQLVNLRHNQIAQQISLARQSLAGITRSPSTNTERLALVNGLDDIIVELEGLMITDDNSVYTLRQQQLDRQAQVQGELANVSQAMSRMGDALTDVEAYAVAQADGAAEQAEMLANAGRTLLIVVTLVVVALLAVFGWRTMVRVLGPLLTMRQQMESISGAGGENADLSMRIDLQRNDEVGQTAQAFNRMMDTFEGMVAQIRQSAEAIAASSRQIASGNENLSQRTDQQASSLAETASSLEQITATVKQTADYADHAKGASSSVDQRARSAGDVAQRTTQAMGDIREASVKITSIVKAIDDIAFQTNLLALNASVEAARAGEQGRGFAVVAQEVRKLAGRSAEEAEQIRHLVDDSVAKVSEGEHLVNSSSTHLQEIVDSLTEVTRYVTEIAQATHEQSSGIEQINQAIAQLDQVTHQNAHLVQEASTESQALDERASDMNLLVSRFTVGEGAGQRDLALPEQKAAPRLS